MGSTETPAQGRTGIYDATFRAWYYLWSEWGLRLPTASAVLAILYPDEFTVYDYRVCAQLDDFYNLATLSKFDVVWRRYQQFRDRVRETTPDGLSLRDKDRYLWGKSAYTQLLADVTLSFGIE